MINEETLSDLSASSSVTSLLRASTGLPRCADTGDLLLEVEDVEEKFFWDFVREPPSSDTSSFAVAFRMLLEEDVIENTRLDDLYLVIKTLQDQHGRAQDLLKGRFLVGALGREWLLRVVVVQDGGDRVSHSSLVAPEKTKKAP